MAKALTLGNGTLLLNFDQFGRLRDLYFPYVGLENQVGGHLFHQLGVFADGQLAWLAAGSGFAVHTAMTADTFTGETEAVNEGQRIRLFLTDTVYNEKNILVRKVAVKNLANRARPIKVFFYQQFEPYESHVAHTAYFDPEAQALIHYRNQRAFLIGGHLEGRPFDDYSTGLYQSGGWEGTYRDAEDGALAKNPIEHGQVDSLIAFSGDYAAGEEKVIYYWLAVGQSIEEVRRLQNDLLTKGAAHLQQTSGNFWRAWVNRQNFSFHGLGREVIDLFKRSLFLIRAHVDHSGGIIASGDSKIFQHGKDTYAYVWPRDGAMAALALALAGDQQLPRAFFSFCHQVLSPEGFLKHKYSPDRSLGSSWHPLVKDGERQLPIQEDETALVVWALWHYYRLSKDLEFVEGVYNDLIRRTADFMTLYRDQATGLPKASFDLWEEKSGVSTFTAAAVYGVLNAAARFADLLGKVKSKEIYRGAAREIKEAILKYLYDEGQGYFQRMLDDPRVDASSVYGIFNFEVLPADDERLRRAVRKTEEILGLKTSVGGLARHENDIYFRVEPSDGLGQDYPGNPWFITTLWLTQYQILRAQSEADLQPVKERFAWVVRHARPSGILSEQLNPFSGEQLSAAPLTWSHAEFVITVIKYLDKLELLGICPACNPVS